MQLVEVVRRHLGGALLHETDSANLPSIERHGLLSRKEAVARGVAAINPGGSALTMLLDDESGLGDSVFLRFLRGGVMPKRDRALERRLVTLRIDPEVLLMPRVRIALGFARRSNTTILKVGPALEKMDWQAMEWAIGMEPYDRSDIYKSARVSWIYDYEIVVPGRVPPEAIIGLEWGPSRG